MLALCLDPGTTHTGMCFFDSETGLVQGSGRKLDNNVLFNMINTDSDADVLVMEDIVPQGLIGRTTIETIKWLGRFETAALFGPELETIYITRPAVKKHLTGKVNKITDKHIRQAVIDKIYPTYTRKDQGLLLGVTADAWSAVAIGIVWSETVGREQAR